MTIFELKIVALIFMVIDHIGLFFPNMPIWFRWIGRLSAPLFIFCMVYGFTYTKNKKIYIIRMYLFGVGMAIMDFLLNYFNNSKLIKNNIFVTLFSIAIIIGLIDFKLKNHPRWKSYFTYFFIWQIFSSLLCRFVDVYFNLKYIYLIMGLAGNIFYNEGGFLFVILGVILYYVKDNKKSITLFYSLFCSIYSLITIFDIIPRIMTRIDYYNFDIFYLISDILFTLLGFKTLGIHYDSVLFVDFQWMMIGALPFFLLYNGKKGKSIKYLFYIFYPLHILILSILRNIIV